MPQNGPRPCACFSHVIWCEIVSGVEISERLVQIAERSQSNPPVHVCGGVAGVEGDRLVEGGQRVLRPAQVRQRDPPAEVGGGVARFESQGLVIVGQRVLRPAQVRETAGDHPGHLGAGLCHHATQPGPCPVADDFPGI
jgi:hypothetical protein